MPYKKKCQLCGFKTDDRANRSRIHCVLSPTSKRLLWTIVMPVESEHEGEVDLIHLCSACIFDVIKQRLSEKEESDKQTIKGDSNENAQT